MKGQKHDHGEETKAEDRHNQHVVLQHLAGQECMQRCAGLLAMGSCCA